MVQQDHQTQPISNDHLSFGIPPTKSKFRRIVSHRFAPKEVGWVAFFPKKWPNLYVVLSLNDPAVDLDDCEHDDEEEESR